MKMNEVKLSFELHKGFRHVRTQEEYESWKNELEKDLLLYVIRQVRQYLRNTGEWMTNVEHERLARRWGHELLERFLIDVPNHLPCRPLYLLDSFLARHFGDSKPFLTNNPSALIAPLGRFINGLLAQAVTCRDASMVLLYHFYSYTPRQVAQVLNLDDLGSQRIYKNFARWRRFGWNHILQTLNLTPADLVDLDRCKLQNSQLFYADAALLISAGQAHYRRSEPEYFPCRTEEEWHDIYTHDYAFDYRTWHLIFCRNCLQIVHRIQGKKWRMLPVPHVNVQFTPPPKYMYYQKTRLSLASNE